MALSDVMFATVGDLRLHRRRPDQRRFPRADRQPPLWRVRARLRDQGRPARHAGRDLQNRQWRAIGKATGLTAKLDMIGPLMDVDMSTEGGRYTARHAIAAVLEPWVAARTLDEVRQALDGSGVLWGPYRSFGQLVAEDPRCSAENPMFEMVEQPSIGVIMTPRVPLFFIDNPGPVGSTSTVDGPEHRGCSDRVAWPDHCGAGSIREPHGQCQLASGLSQYNRRPAKWLCLSQASMRSACSAAP